MDIAKKEAKIISIEQLSLVSQRLKFYTDKEYAVLSAVDVIQIISLL
ncbi:MAG: hypothetical protein ACI3Z9_04225 [Candidatus Onthomorpha sp.]